MNQKQRAQTLATYLSWVVGAVLVMLPFHAFFTTWAGSNLGNIDLFRIWKECMIVALVPFALYFVWNESTVRRWFVSSWLVRLIGGYMLLYITLGAVAFFASRVSTPALVYSWFGSLRFLGFFVLVVVISSQSGFLRRYWKHIVLLPALIVIGFGLLQRTWLPYDFLRHFGYGPKTIPAYQTIDSKLDYRRIQSTLRGANPLGAYLVLVVSTFVALFHRRRNKWLLVAVVGTAMTLVFSYSRSSYIGAIAAVSVIIFLSIKNRRTRQWLVIASVTTILIGGSLVMLLRRNDIVENTLFHTDNSSLSQESSNSGRTRSLQQGFSDVIHEPFGRGPGTAGPQSFRNNHPPRIAENYFLQVAQEVGIVGLAFFVAINLLIARLLWRQRQNPLALALLASLAGLTIVNLFSHAWADDTLGLLWWGLAGIVVGHTIARGNKIKQPNVRYTED